MSGFRNAKSLALAVTALIGFTPVAAQAQDAWPSKRISLVVGFAVGGFADSVGRIIGAKLGERLKQSVIVQNMEGAGGNTAARQVSVAPADGYTILVTTTGLAINETLYKNKGFAAASLTPIAIPVSAPESLVANPKSGIKTFPDLIAAAKEGKAFMGTPGIGSGSHIAAEYFFKNVAKIQVKHIPFQGGNPAMQGLLSGDINILASTATAATIPPVASGELVGLGVASTERDPALPNVPTIDGAGLKGYEVAIWNAFFGPKGMAKDSIARINAALVKAMADSGVNKRLTELAVDLPTPEESTPAALATQLKASIDKWVPAVRAAGVKPE